MIFLSKKVVELVSQQIKSRSLVSWISVPMLNVRLPSIGLWELETL